MSIYLLEVQAHNGSAVTTLRFATKTYTTRNTETPANTLYDGRIMDPGHFERVAFDGRVGGGARVSVGSIELANPDGALDYLYNLGFGREATLKRLATINTPLASAETVLKFYVTNVESASAFNTIRLRARMRSTELELPFLTATYAGTTLSAGATIEGDATLKGQLKPMCFGTCPHVPGKPVNPFNLIWQFAANPGGVSSIVVYDGGLVLTATSDYPNLAALLAATIPNGSYATCVALGIARLGWAPDKTVTADVVEGATAALRSASRICQRILDLVPNIGTADMDAAGFTAFHTAAPAEVCLYVDSDLSTANLLADVAESVLGAILPTYLGIYSPFWLRDPLTGTSVATVTERQLLRGGDLTIFAGPSDEGDGVPAYSVAMNWGPVWRPLAGGDLIDVIAEATDGANAALKDYLGKKFRPTAPAVDAAVQTKYARAQAVTHNSTIVLQAAAEAEAARRLALLKVRRDKIGFPADLSDLDVEANEIVTVQFENRLGYTAGKKMLCCGVREDFAREIRTGYLWG